MAFCFITSCWYILYLITDLTIFSFFGIVFLVVDVFLFFMLLQIGNNESVINIKSKEKILIFAPHQDDCVLMAGGIAIKNIEQGGEVKIIYLTQSQDKQKAELRKNECINAWKMAGLNQKNLVQLDILPSLYEMPDKQKIEVARERIQNIVDDYQPTTVIFPLFEGGHRHHDITNYIASFLLKYPKRTLLYEAPLYSMYYSMINTPHKIVKLVTRFVSLNTIAYFPPAEGIDSRKIHVLNMSIEEIQLKNRMLLAFNSQNGESLSRNYGYADRLVKWRPDKYKASAFVFSKNLAEYIAKMYQLFPYKLAKAIYPTDISSHGYKYGITNMDYELNRTDRVSDVAKSIR